MAGCLDNVQLPNVDGCVEVGDKRNKVASIISGILVSTVNIFIFQCDTLGLCV